MHEVQSMRLVCWRPLTIGETEEIIRAGGIAPNSPSELTAIRDRLTSLAHAYLSKRWMAKSPSDQDMRRQLKLIYTFVHALIEWSTGDLPLQDLIRVLPAVPLNTSLSNYEVGVDLRNGAASILTRKEGETSDVRRAELFSQARAELASASQTLGELDSRLRLLANDEEESSRASALASTKREARLCANDLQWFLATIEIAVERLNWRINSIAARRRERREEARQLAADQNAPSSRYAPGSRQNKEFDGLLGGLWAVFHDLTGRLPRTKVGVEGSADPEKATGPYINFIATFLRCVKGLLSNPELVDDLVMKAELSLSADAIRERVRHLGITSKVDALFGRTGGHGNGIGTADLKPPLDS